MSCWSSSSCVSVVFLFLPGVHPFGPWDQPTVVSGNITSHRVVNWTLMEDFPLWVT